MIALSILLGAGLIALSVDRSVPTEIRACRFVLVDSKGVEVGWLAATSDGPGLSLAAGDRNLGLDLDGMWLSRGTEMRAFFGHGLSGGEEGYSLVLDAPGEISIAGAFTVLRRPDGVTLLELKDDNGKTLWERHSLVSGR